MCLTLKNVETVSKIAKKDIIVYKGLSIPNIDYSFKDKLKHGDSFKGIIGRVKCKGKININQNGNVCFCTNNKRLNGGGGYGNDRLGYKYSWCFDGDVDKLIVNKETLIDKEDIAQHTKTFLTPYQRANVEIGKTYDSILYKDYDVITFGLHSFSKLKDVKRITRVIAKCIIPKGSEYYEGTFEDKGISYASNKITYLKIVK